MILSHISAGGLVLQWCSLLTMIFMRSATIIDLLLYCEKSEEV